MQYTQYKAALEDALRKVAEQDGSMLKMYQATIKVDMAEADAVALMYPNSNVGTSVYVEDLYNRFENGESLVKQVEIIRQKALQDRFRQFELSNESIRTRCVPQCIGVKGNEQMLKKVPHRIIGDDMAVIPRIDMGHEGSFILNETVMQLYQLSKNEILDQAITNQEQKPYVLLSLEQKMSEIMGEPQDSYYNNGTQIMILTNESGIFGASEIANRKAMAEATENLEGDFWILPSSLHEILLVPATGNIETEALKDMVVSVNETTLEKADILSNSVYFYDSQKHTITNSEKIDLSQRRNNAMSDVQTLHVSHHM